MKKTMSDLLKMSSRAEWAAYCDSIPPEENAEAEEVWKAASPEQRKKAELAATQFFGLLMLKEQSALLEAGGYHLAGKWDKIEPTPNQEAT